MSTLTSRRRLQAIVAIAVSGLAIAACGTTGDDSSDGGAQGAGDCKATIAFVGPNTGAAANLGNNIVYGAQVALGQYEGDCKVTLKKFDTQGDPSQATGLVSSIVSDKNVIGVIGPTFSGETQSTGAAFNEGGLVTVSASATNPDLSGNDWKTFHRIIGTDAAQAPAQVALMTGELAAKKIFVIDDASEYGKGLGDAVAKLVTANSAGRATIQQGDRDFNPVVTKVVASGADAVYFGGYYAEGGLLVNQLRAGGFTGRFVAGDGVLDPAFIEAAGGGSANNSYLTCPCGPSPAEFAKAYQEEHGQAPGTYSPEGFDIMNMYLEGLDAGNTDREKMLKFIDSYSGEGITKKISFEDNGDIKDVTVYSFPITDGKLDFSVGKPIEQ